MTKITITLTIFTVLVFIQNSFAGEKQNLDNVNAFGFITVITDQDHPKYIVPAAVINIHAEQWGVRLPDGTKKDFPKTVKFKAIGEGKSHYDFIQNVKKAMKQNDANSKIFADWLAKKNSSLPRSDQTPSLYKEQGDNLNAILKTVYGLSLPSNAGDLSLGLGRNATFSNGMQANITTIILKTKLAYPKGEQRKGAMDLMASDQYVYGLETSFSTP